MDQGIEKPYYETNVPFVELLFLARDLEWRGQGIGPMLLLESLRCVTEVADRIGVFGVHLMPTREGRRLYRSFGFEAVREIHGHFWMPLAQIRLMVEGL